MPQQYQPFLHDLITVLKVTGLAELVASVALAAGLVVARM